MPRQQSEMLGRAVALVGEKIIFRIRAMVFGHHAIPRHLGDNRRGGDRLGKAIARDDGSLWNRHEGNRQRVKQEKVRDEGHRRDCPSHSQTGGFQNIDLVDFLFARGADPDDAGFRCDRRIQTVALRFGQLLGIV